MNKHFRGKALTLWYIAVGHQAPLSFLNRATVMDTIDLSPSWKLLTIQPLRFLSHFFGNNPCHSLFVGNTRSFCPTSSTLWKVGSTLIGWAQQLPRHI
ncbi:hypothetical protein BO94DRAFT_529632 [Aspergillus sclerotioniger CBS 115572]|uniref:Uncharacterized protein n=1 Tax=Aspergillus sclerotioniger CBS 115572 TaxID=1450535 RepID=A0A317XCJ7_9EURO|nr:hypothetical protein BO94DRAFT_529632 [Aspergillus sclerotioniger CBS 115572]PWY96239.1 hypothetical protein BO94DRAFT_529632 [Aspergillus sclerotioniger CBS 115572]